MCDSKLSAGARLVYQMLDDYARATDSAWPSQETISGRLGLTVRTVQRHLAKLEAAHYILRRRRSVAFGRNEYVLARDFTPDKTEPLPTELSGVLTTPLSGVLPTPVTADPPPVSQLNEAEQLEALPPNPPETGEPEASPEASPEAAQTLAIEQSHFDELADGYDRHLKHHRSEPRDTVLQIVMDLAQRSRFDWEKYRARHGLWCEAQQFAGWRFANLTFLGWIRAGYPPPAPSERRRGGGAEVIDLMRERIRMGYEPL